VDAALFKTQDSTPRPYVGMSGIGHPCARKVWMDFRFASVQKFKAATLRKFDDGHRSEAAMADQLRLVKNLKLDTCKPDGTQHGFTDHGKHFRGHMDGAVLGLLEAPKTWHVWEHKACDEKKQNALEKFISVDEKTALMYWDQTYFVQAQLYMHYTKMKRHFLTCGSAGNRKVISCRTDYDKATAEKWIALAKNLITTDAPPDRLSADPAYFVCKHMCAHSDICHGTQMPIVSCRTCVHGSASFEAEGEWHCAYHKRFLSVSDQRAACDDHIYNPNLMNTWAMVVDSDEYHNAIQYTNQKNGEMFWNGKGKEFYSSKELFACEDKGFVASPEAEEIFRHFDGKIIG
jgi:hypothetical protein